MKTTPRFPEREYPDKADCLALGLCSRAARIKSRNRRAARRLWKRIARRAWAEALRGVRPRLAARRMGVVIDEEMME